MTSKRFLLALSFLLIAFSCDVNEGPQPDLNEVSRLIVSAEDIPEVTSSLLQEMGLRSGNNGRFSINGSESIGFNINWDRIKQLIDSTGKQTYTFGIEDTDNDPSTFYNLVFKISPDGDAYRPYVLKYTMNDDFANNYYAGIESFKTFRGQVQKTVITSTLSNLRGEAPNERSEFGDSGDELVGVDPCPNPTDIGNNNNSGSSGGGGNNNSNQNNSDNSNDNNTCDVYVLETDWYACVSVGNEVPDCHYSYTEYELVYENCGPDDSLSANLENDDACSDDDDNVPIIEPEDFGYKVCNKHIAFDEIPGDGSETSLTGEVRRVQVPAVHTETGEHVEAFLGGLVHYIWK